MARRPRLAKRIKEGLFPTQREHLLIGSVILDYLDDEWPPYARLIDSGMYPFRDDAHRRRVWDEHREVLIAEYQRQPNNADRYPAAFWEYDSGIARQKGESIFDFLRRCRD